MGPLGKALIFDFSRANPEDDARQKPCRAYSTRSPSFFTIPPQVF